MPPRKSTTSVVSAAAPSPNGAGEVSLLSAAPTEPKSPISHKANRQSTTGEADGEKIEKKKSKHDDVGIDDLLLPRTLTSRLSRGTLPPNTSIQRDALLALTKSATVFISYIAHTANNLTFRKTIQSQDILDALRDTELWNVAITGSARGETLGDRVQAEVEKWEGEVRGKRKGYRDRVKARESTNTGEGADEDEDDQGTRGPIAKKIRRGSQTDGADTTMDVDIDNDGEGSEDAAAAQLRSEGEAAIARRDRDGDGTETDPEVVDDEDEGVDEEEEEEDEDPDSEQQDDDDDNDDDEQEDQLENMHRDEDDIDVEEDSRRKTTLAPNGRVEVGSDEDSD